jgi:hypothetical protein
MQDSGKLDKELVKKIVRTPPRFLRYCIKSCPKNGGNIYEWTHKKVNPIQKVPI